MLRWIYWWYRYNSNAFRTNFRILIGFIYYKLQLRNIEPDLELPFYGQLCMFVNRGYKIFDIRRGIVIKIFNLDIDSATIMNEIERMKNVSQIDFAPSIRRWNIEERWYEEDYISGSLESGKPPDSKNLLKIFYKYIVPCNITLILYRKPMTRNSVDYVNEIIEILDASRLSRQGLDSKNIRKISNFTHSIVEHLQGYENCPCYLVFTHGDFCPENMLNTKHGLRIFDWESSEYRSALFDFYSYFFYRPVQHNLPVDKLVSEINEALPFFISKLDLKVPDIAKSLLSFEKVYRWLYYIERVSMLVKREKTDKNLDIMKYILRYIDVFNCYEEKVNDNLSVLN